MLLVPVPVQAGVGALHLIRRQFFWYLTGDMMLGAVVAILQLRLLAPALRGWLGQARAAPAWRLAAQGVLAALLPLALTVLTALAAHAYDPHSPGWVPFQGTLRTAFVPAGWMVWLFFAVQSTFEELLYRGVGVALFALLLAWIVRLTAPPTALADGLAPTRTDPLSGRAWFWAGLLANLVVSVAFGLSHGDNPGVSYFALANIALAGFVLGQLYWLQGNLWGCCAMHTVWNASLATVGLPVSGILARGPLIGNLHGSVPGLLTGGNFGPEASAVTTAGLLGVGAWLVWRSWQQGTRRSAGQA